MAPAPTFAMSEPERLEISAQDLMPSWVTNIEKSLSDRGADTRREDRGENERDRGQKHGGGGGRGPRREGDRNFGGRDSRDSRGGGGGGFRRERDDRGRGGPRGGGRNRDRDGRDGRDGREGGDRGPRRFEEPLPSGITVSLEPGPRAVDALARHIRQTGRTYAVADLARMVLGGRDRYQIRFRTDSVEERPLYACAADHSVWLSREEAIAHLLRSPGVLDRYYAVEVVSVEPPKGNFSVVAVCGFTGQVLGPPNHHEYQMNVARLHRERFSDMSLERFKARIEMRRDEETIEKWKEQVSTRRQYRVRPEPLSDDALAEASADGPVAGEASGAENESVAAAPTAGSVEAVMAGDSPVVESDPAPEAANELQPEAVETDAAPLQEAAGEEEVESVEESAEESAEGSVESESSEADESVPVAEDSAGGEILTSEEALERHFRKVHADLAAEPVSEAVVPGDVPGRCLARPLLNLLKGEVERGRKAFPLTMIQHLCREFEKSGLKFFKRGKKALHVSVTRPRAIPNETELSDRVREIVAFVRQHPKKKVVDLLDALVSDYEKPAQSETFEGHQLTGAERGVLADLRWLTMEGFVIEFPGTELLLGRIEPTPPKSEGETTAAAAPPKRKRKPSRQKESAPVDVEADAPRPEETAPAPDPEPVVAETPPPATEEAVPVSEEIGSEPEPGEVPVAEPPEAPVVASVETESVAESEVEPDSGEANEAVPPGA